jgi:HEAT repeat protein
VKEVGKLREYVSKKKYEWFCEEQSKERGGMNKKQLIVAFMMGILLLSVSCVYAEATEEGKKALEEYKKQQGRNIEKKSLIEKDDSLATILLKLRDFSSRCKEVEEISFAIIPFQELVLERFKANPESVASELSDRTAPVVYRQLLIEFATEIPEQNLQNSIRSVANNSQDETSVRIFAIRALGRWKTEEDKMIIRKLLNDTAEEIRREAVAALPASLSDSDIKIVSNELHSDDYMTQILAIRALGLSKSEVSEKSLLEFINSDEMNPTKVVDTNKRIVRMNAVGALGNLSSEVSQSTLRSILLSANEHSNVRKAAAEALSRHPSAENSATLITALKDASADLAVIIVQSLAAMNDKSVIPVLTTRLNETKSTYEIEELKKAISKLEGEGLN